MQLINYQTVCFREHKIGEYMKSEKSYKFDKLLIGLAIAIVPTFALMLVAKFAANIVVAIIGSIICVIEMITLSIVILFVFKDMAKTMIDDYKSRNNLFSGALCIILIAVTSYLLFKGFGDTFYKDQTNDFSNMANTIITLTPALLSLLGVHYSNMIQETRRKEDFRVANTPCPLIECYVERIQANNVESIYIKVTIKNLVNNILIPLYIGNNKLSYLPVTKEIKREFENIEIPYHDYKNVFFIYEDSSGNTYKTKLDIKIDKEFQNNYTTTKNDEPVLLMPGDLLMLQNKNCNENSSYIETTK
jgi:hypothetical protein